MPNVLEHKCTGNFLPEAWQLPEFQQFLEELRLEKVTCHGCAVGLRTKDKKLPLCNGWTIATQNEELLQHLNLRCQKNHARGKCEAGQTAHTARYTTPFVRKVVDSLSMHESLPRTLQELNKPETALPAEEGEAEDDVREGEVLAEGEKEEIETKIHQIHRATGHGSMKNLIEALEKRGVSNKVLQVAKQWKCPMCETYKRQDSRRFSTSETMPRRWQRVQMDMESWCHPGTSKKFHFLMMVDEGGRFRMGRIVSYNPAKNTTWTTSQQVFTESWLPNLGQPQVLRVDPQGPMMSKQADSYASEHGMELQLLPAEARWQISLVEGAIKATKGMMETLSGKFPDMPPAELLGRAIWVMNRRDLFKGDAPLQHALGRGPDEHDHLFESPQVQPLGPELLDDGGFRLKPQTPMSG